MVHPWAPFSSTYSDETDFDWDDFNVEWFCRVDSAEVAQARLDFLRSPGNIYKLQAHGYGGPAVQRMWRSVLRACIGYSIPLAPAQVHMAQELGIVVP